MTMKLPRVASELIRLALTDLERAEKSDLHRVDMDVWHRRVTYELCSVCLAGAVMAFSLEQEPDSILVPEDFDSHTKNALNALNEFRAGWPRAGLETMGVWYDEHDVPRTRMMAKYEHEPVKFKKQMVKLADDLERAGL